MLVNILGQNKVSDIASEKIQVTKKITNME